MTTGAICVNTLKKDWTAETTFSHVLSVIRCLLINPFPESSLNDEAGKLFMESYDEYSKRARLMTDVHGRPRSSETSGGGEKRKSGLKDDENDDSPQRRKPGANPLASKNSNSISSTSSSKTGKTLGSKQASGKTKKKKNLKRL